MLERKGQSGCAKQTEIEKTKRGLTYVSEEQNTHKEKPC